MIASGADASRSRRAPGFPSRRSPLALGAPAISSRGNRRLLDRSNSAADFSSSGKKADKLALAQQAELSAWALIVLRPRCAELPWRPDCPRAGRRCRRRFARIRRPLPLGGAAARRNGRQSEEPTLPIAYAADFGQTEKGEEKGDSHLARLRATAWPGNRRDGCFPETRLGRDTRGPSPLDPSPAAGEESGSTPCDDSGWRSS